MDLNKEIFKGKSLSKLFKEIYDNSKNTREQVLSLITNLSDTIENNQDARVTVPLIKEYLEIGVKNDEHLIKLATVIQRLESKTREDTSLDLMDLESLLQEQENATKQLKKGKENSED